MPKPRKMLLVMVLIATFLVIGGCNLVAPPAPPTTTAVPLPELPAYNRVEGQTLTGYIGTLSGGAALLAGQPELAAAAAVIEGVASCYQEVGAVRFGVYSQVETPLAAGAVAIADRDALASPSNLFRCAAPALAPQRAAPEGASFQPCQHTYTLTKEENEYYIAYAATQQQVCQAFCDSLEGCTGH